MAAALKDADLLRDVEELAAIGVGFDRLCLIVRQRHEERHLLAHLKRYGLPLDSTAEEVDFTPPRGASERTVSRYLAAIRERWAKEEVEHRPQRRQELRQKLQATFLKAYEEGGPSMGAAVRCLQVMAKIDGLEAPQKIEVNGQIDIKAMSPDQRRARMIELWAIRQKAIAAGEVIDVPAKPKKLSAPKKPAKKTQAKKAKTKKKAPVARKTRKK